MGQNTCNEENEEDEESGVHGPIEDKDAPLTTPHLVADYVTPSSHPDLEGEEAREAQSPEPMEHSQQESDVVVKSEEGEEIEEREPLGAIPPVDLEAPWAQTSGMGTVEQAMVKDTPKPSVVQDEPILSPSGHIS